MTSWAIGLGCHMSVMYCNYTTFEVSYWTSQNYLPDVPRSKELTFTLGQNGRLEYLAGAGHPRDD